ncbi:VOC family protein [Leptospira vanthielii]|uniref:Glyoxalase-like domain protein n=1 Tax=Leptospira vanthielii serovar Holland str. Waz Holland = ATCC 700522 TaxID=1218591 RepID=N1WAB6_9LEPT|nr:VOC family protein [Leptospira vanthielii]EMY71938.1 glyoxalase-like domain protein [Leptospira vanthielii serovar Holland str. Waz Holland = ATCC 700522]
MKKVILLVVVFVFLLCNCKKETSMDVSLSNLEINAEQSGKQMKNTISIVEIPVSDLSRAVSFYQAILSVSIERMTMGDTEMGVLPATEGSVNVVLVKGKDYIPTNNGVLIYLNIGNDLQPALEKVEKNGGKVLLPKTEISPEMGYYAMFVDSEGNKIGMHSHP